MNLVISKNMKVFFCVIFLSLSGFSMANTVILVNGVGSGQAWVDNGIYQRLSSDNKVIIADLPYWLPLEKQSSILHEYVNMGGSSVTIVGHSAGGVVGRNVLAITQDPAIKSLITIASPHLGSGAARLSGFLNNKVPFGNLVSGLLSKEMEKSRYTVNQLKDTSVFLLGLNRIKHPSDTCYVSIVKTGGVLGDFFAEPYSQDMNNVNSSISSRVMVGRSGHGLSRGDYGLISKSISICSGMSRGL